MFFCRHWDRLWVVLHFSSGIVAWAKRERAWKSPHARSSPFLAWVIFTRARVSLTLLSLRKNGWLLVDCTRSLGLRTRTMKNWEWRCKFKHKILVKKDFSRSKWSQKSIRSTSQAVIRKNPTLSAAKHKTKLFATKRSLLMPVKMSFSSIRVKHYISSKLLIKGTKRTSTVAYCKLKKWLTWCFWNLPKEKVLQGPL